MDELKNLRDIMKNDTFKDKGFNNRIRNNILDEVHSGNTTRREGRKLLLAPILSFIIIATSFTLFLYFTGNQLGFIGEHSGNQMKYYEMNLENKPEELRNRPIKLPTKLPFEFKGISAKHSEKTHITTVSIEGTNDQFLKVRFVSGVDSADLSRFEPITVRGYRGMYLEGAEYGTNNLSWLEVKDLYTVTYISGEARKSLPKRVMIEIAESFR